MTIIFYLVDKKIMNDGIKKNPQFLEDSYRDIIWY